MVKVDPFFIQFDHTYLHGDLLPYQDMDAPNILFLHGIESPESRTLFFMLRQVLFNQYHISSCSFDFVGHGDTGGRYSNNLQYRLRQVMDIVDACFDSRPFSVVSSQPDLACALAQVRPVQHLMLLASWGAYPYRVGETGLIGKEAGTDCDLGGGLGQKACKVTDLSVGVSRSLGEMLGDPACLAELARGIAGTLAALDECKEM